MRCRQPQRQPPPERLSSLWLVRRQRLPRLCADRRMRCRQPQRQPPSGRLSSLWHVRRQRSPRLYADLQMRCRPSQRQPPPGRLSSLWHVRWRRSPRLCVDPPPPFQSCPHCQASPVSSLWHAQLPLQPQPCVDRSSDDSAPGFPPVPQPAVTGPAHDVLRQRHLHSLQIVSLWRGLLPQPVLRFRCGLRAVWLQHDVLHAPAFPAPVVPGVPQNALSLPACVWLPGRWRAAQLFPDDSTAPAECYSGRRRRTHHIQCSHQCDGHGLYRDRPPGYTSTAAAAADWPDRRQHRQSNECRTVPVACCPSQCRTEPEYSW